MVVFSNYHSQVSSQSGWLHLRVGGSVAEWLTCWTQAQKGPGSNRSRHCRAAVLGKLFIPIVQMVPMVAALLKVVGVTASLAESNGSLPPGLRLTSPAG